MKKRVVTEDQKQYRREWNAYLIEQKICVNCNQPNDRDEQCCSSCSQKQSAQRSKRKLDAAAGGKHVCTACMKAHDGPRKTCNDCLARTKLYQDTKYAANLCIQCGKTREGRKRFCSDCRAQRMIDNNERKAKWREAGLCSVCGKHIEHPDSNQCNRCCVGGLAKTHLGSRDKTQLLIDMFNAQRGLCALCKEPMILGKNASLDHIHPRSKGGALYDISNLQWVLYEVNIMKHAMLIERFVDLCGKIHANKTAVDNIVVNTGS